MRSFLEELFILVVGKVLQQSNAVGESKNMDIVWIVMKYNKTIGRFHSHHHFYKVCGDEETAIEYVDKLNNMDEENHYYYYSEMVR